MNILFRAIITGFGLRLGSEVARTIATKVRDRDESKAKTEAEKEAEAEEEEEHPTSVTPDPPAV